MSDCLPPCHRTTATVVEGSQYNCNYGSFSIFFSDTVELKKTMRESISVFDVLTVVNLALWPALGLYQVLEGSLLVGNTILSKLCSRCTNQRVAAEEKMY